MALKVSGASKCSKTVQTDANFKVGQTTYPEFDTNSNPEGVPYPYGQTGSSNSTPAWDYTRTTHRPESRFNAFSGGRESMSSQFGDVTLESEDEPKEWMAQVEPGVQITFVSLPRGGNDLKRIRFRYTC